MEDHMQLHPDFHALDEQLLRQLAGPASFERGLGYFQNGNSSTVEVASPEVVRATVTGESSYVTQLLVRPGGLRGSCSCPVGQRGAFCKHAVAVGLHLLDELDRLDPALREAPATEAKRPVRARRAPSDPPGPTPAPAAQRRSQSPADIRTQLQDVFRFSGFLDYRRAGQWTAPAWDAVDAISSLLPHDPASAIKLSEYAFKRLDAVSQRMDDSDGGLSDVLYRAQQVHLEACLLDPGDQRKLARRLFAFETEHDLDVLVDALAAYAEALGEDGRAEYRSLAEAAWRELEPRVRAAGHLDQYLTGSYSVRRIIEQIALADRDVDRLVELLGGQLETSSRYARLAEVLLSIGELETGREWALRGLEQHPNDDRLQRALLTCAQAGGQDADALKLAWQLFTRRHDIERFELLHACAERLDAWPEWQARAFESARTATPQDASAIATLLLHVGEADAAWDAAQALGCSRLLWEQLASARAADHPADAAAIYLSFALAAVTRASPREYDTAIMWLTRADALLGTTAERALFDEAVATLRTRHERKRALLTRLDARGWA